MANRKGLSRASPAHEIELVEAVAETLDIAGKTRRLVGFNHDRVQPRIGGGRLESSRRQKRFRGHAATAVTAGNAGDAAAAAELLADELAAADQPRAEQVPEAEQPQAGGTGQRDAEQPDADPDPPADVEQSDDAEREPSKERLSVYGDSAYGSGELINKLEQAGAEVNCKVQPPVAPGGRFSKDAFNIDLDEGTVGCPAGHTVALKATGDGQLAHFGQACAGCPLAARCTTAREGRSVYVGPYEQQLARARACQRDPAWKADYTATRPKVERKISHLMRRRHGGRRARVRGKPKVSADFALLAAAVNLTRLAVLGLAAQQGVWQANTA